MWNIISSDKLVLHVSVRRREWERNIRCIFQKSNGDDCDWVFGSLLWALGKVRLPCHYGDVIMGAISSQIASHTIVYSTVYSDADQRKHQSSASLAFVWGIHRGPVNSPHKWPVTRKMFQLNDVIMQNSSQLICDPQLLKCIVVLTMQQRVRIKIPY